MTTQFQLIIIIIIIIIIIKYFSATVFCKVGYLHKYTDET